MSEWVHATAVLVGADGVLIRGPSGAGKSALALALIDGGGRLIADDRVHLSARSGRLIATALEATAGRMELRGRGIVAVPHERTAIVRLVVDCVPADALERLPEPASLTTSLLGVAVARQPVPPDQIHALSLIRAALADLTPAQQALRSARL